MTTVHRWLYPLFLASGATSLTYQLLWERQLHLVFGTSTFAVAAVLSTFMAGLSLGGWLGGQWADRTASPMLAYAGLEVLIGVYALGFPTLLSMLQPLYLAWDVTLPVVGLALLAPTTAMGATLPLLARVATDGMSTAGSRLGTLYAVNTAGAVLGTAIAAFWMLPSLGLWSTTMVAAGGNLAIAGCAAWVARDVRVDPAQSTLAASAPLIAAVMATAGMAGMIYEVTWTRVLALVLGATVHAFAVMLLAFLVGIAVGGQVGGAWADRLVRRGGPTRALVALSAVQLGIGVASYALSTTYSELPYAYVSLFDWLGVSQQPGLAHAVSLLLAGAVMIPPAFLMGVGWPLAVRAVLSRPGSVGRSVGHVAAANTLGASLGALVTGFVLLPELEVTGTLGVALLLNAGAGMALAAAAWKQDARAAWLLVPGVILAVASRAVPWQPRVMTSGLYHYVSHFGDHSRDGVDRFGIRSYDLLFYEEGPTTVVTVGRDHATGAHWLANNGKVEATSQWDLPTQVLVGALPLQFVSDPKDVLLIGLASGITGGAVASDPRIERLDIVEIEPATIRAAAWFETWNGGILDDARVRLHANDGRNHVLRAAPGSYDLIVSEPSNPWITGVSNLFTREFFALGKTRLAPGGVWAQWLHAYGMGQEELRSLLGTFADVYPHVVVYDALNVSDLVLVGSESPLVPDARAAQYLVTEPSVARAVGAVGVTSELDVVARFLLDRQGVLAVAGNVGLNTDDNMRVEYAAPGFVHLDTTAQNASLILEHAQLPPVRDPVLLRALAEVYTAADDPRARLIDGQVPGG